MIFYWITIVILILIGISAIILIIDNFVINRKTYLVWNHKKMSLRYTPPVECGKYQIKREEQIIMSYK